MAKVFSVLFTATIFLTSYTPDAVAQRLPVRKTEAEKALSAQRAASGSFFKSDAANAFPAGMIQPGEFEESQAVAISWAFDYDVNFNIIGVDTFSDYGKISAQVADAIQKEATVWIRINAGKDSLPIKSFMQRRGTPLTNYRFMVTTGDDWWTRDYGPMAFYYGSQDNIGFVDMKYYDGRDYDNLFPAQLAQKMGYPNYISRVNAEGGNLMADGFGQMVFSDVITSVNADGTIHSPAWAKPATLDTLKNIFNTPVLHNLKTLSCDGGTGHIDLYLKYIDEQTILASQYPGMITAVDRQRIEDNVQYLAQQQSTYNRPLRIIRVEHPTNDNGQHTRLNCSQINADARTFVNGLTINKTYIFPTYTDGVTGNIAQCNRVKTFFEKVMPGYKVVPIDCRAMSPLGGEIHCITMQIPVENPIRFWHPSVDGIQPNQSKYHIVAKVTNKSGIANVKCFWRKNSTAWQSFNLTDSAGYFVGNINNPGITGSDVISYYLSANSNNGRTAVKPITAPTGFYTIRLKYATGMDDPFVQPEDHLFAAYPVPAQNTINIPFHLTQGADVKLVITDISGRQMMSLNKGAVDMGMHTEPVQIEQLQNGMYFYTLLLNNVAVSTRRFSITR